LKIDYCLTYFWFHIRNEKIKYYEIRNTKRYRKWSNWIYADVLSDLENRGILEDTDSAALTILARNYSIPIKSSKQLEKNGLTEKARTKLLQKEKDEDDSLFAQFIKTGKETR